MAATIMKPGLSCLQHKTFLPNISVWRNCRTFIAIGCILTSTIFLLRIHLHYVIVYENTETDDDLTKNIYSHNDNVDLRIMVLTYNRPVSLSQTLHSLKDFILDGDRASVHIWIDRSKENNILDGDTYRVAKQFKWPQGPVTIHVNEKHVGIYGQWIHTWRPFPQGVVNDNADEPITLYIEDDVDVSPYAYRWLRNVYDTYVWRDDISMFCLQDENVYVASGAFKDRELIRPKNTPLFLFQIPGAWGCAPHPRRWKEFQNWCRKKREDISFTPITNKAELHSKWYTKLSKQGKEDTMWTMWYIYYSIQNDIYSVYSNLPKYTGFNNVSLIANRKEKGVHGQRVKPGTAPLRLTLWDEALIKLPQRLPKYNVKGNRIVEQ